MTQPDDTAAAPVDLDERFRTWVVPELDVMYRVARSLTRNDADAEDLVQDSLVRAYRALDRFDGRYPRAWLLTIVRNTHLNRIRRKRPGLLDDPDDTFERLAADPDDGWQPEQAVVDPVFDDRVDAALDALPEKFRGVVQLVDIEGRSYAEAAEELGVPVGTVMSRLHRARTKMRERLAGDGFHRRATKAGRS